MVSTITWTGAGHNTKWSNAANWSPAGPPNSSQAVALPYSTVDYTVVLDESVSFIASLTVGTGATLNVGANSLATTGAVSFNKGSAAKVGKSGTLSSGGALTINSATLINSGTVETTGLEALTIENITSPTTNNGTISASGALIFKNNSSTVVNAKGAKIATASSLNFDASPFVNSGVVQVGGNASFTGGSVTTNAGSTFTTTGHLILNGTALTENGGTKTDPGGSISVGGNLLVEGGVTTTVGAFASLKSTGTLTFNNVTVTDAGLITGGSVALSNNTTFNLNGVTLTATGAVSLESGTTLVATGAAEIDAASVTGTGKIDVGSDTKGGTLTINGQVGSGLNIVIDSVTASNLIIPSASSDTIKALSLSSSKQTLTVDGKLTLSGAEAVNNAHLVLNDGTVTDTSGISLKGGTLAGSGTIKTGAAGFDGGTVTAKGGTLEFNSVVDATAATTFTIAAGAALAFDKAVGTGETVHPTINFVGSNASLNLVGEGLAEPAVFQGVVKNFDKGNNQNDTIVVRGSGNGTDTAYFNTNNHTLYVENGAETKILAEVVMGSGSPTEYTVAESGNVDTIRAVTNSYCFYPGTLVRTPDGEVAVETIKPGDLVATADGRAVAVNWVGKQTVSMRFADPLRVLPIRIHAGALDENVPARDLLVSPDHALLIEGALIQAGALVNGTSIARETRVPAVFTYYHVETDDHSLILAENAPAETFVDNVDRLNFDNWSEFEALYPDGKVVEELPYPRAKSHRQVPVRVRVKLAERALAAGFAERGVA